MSTHLSFAEMVSTETVKGFRVTLINYLSGKLFQMGMIEKKNENLNFGINFIECEALVVLKAAFKK